jgi:dTDP-4-amino-4,6-dideoxygalactose transaminase
MSAIDVDDNLLGGAAAASNSSSKGATDTHQLADVEINIAHFPPAKVPTTPVLSMASLRGEGGKHVPSVLDAAEVKFVTSGRVAIGIALKQMGVGPGDTVLVPSYHCASMIEPVIWAGAKPVFYRIHRDTSVDLDDIAAKIDGTTIVVMATNYFGFPQDLPALRALVDARGLKLLEDCAHSFLGECKGKPIGSYGDYAIASSMKFFPIYEGGCLVSARHSLASVNLHSAGLGFETKVAFNTLEDGFEYRRLTGIKILLWLPMALKNFLWRQIKARKTNGVKSLSPGSSDGGFGFDPNWLGVRSSYFARTILKLTSRRRMADLRRANYLKLFDALRELPGCRPLFPTLPDGVYPWVFPLVVEDTKRVFKVLKCDGVPIIRFGEYLWEGVDASVCAASVELSQGVLQFPCHQELRPEEIDWMIAKIKGALQTQRAQLA